jgi:hypothetical protein
MSTKASEKTAKKIDSLFDRSERLSRGLTFAEFAAAFVFIASLFLIIPLAITYLIQKLLEFIAAMANRRS